MIKKTTVHPIVGTVEWETDALVSGNDITLLGNLEQKITTVTVPQLNGVLDARDDAFLAQGKKFDGKLRFFKPAHSQLLAAFAEIEKEGLKARLISCAGSFNARLQKRKGGGFVQTPSNHAFGTAIDLNAEFNGQGDKPPAIGKKGSVRELVPIFEKHGFKWGGDFNTPDGMHFEVMKLLPDDQITVPVPVVIKVNGQIVAVPALLIEETTWVGAKTMITLLDNHDNNTTDGVIGFGGNPLKITVLVNGTSHALDGVLLVDTGYVRFKDLQPLYSVPFLFKGGEKPSLELTV